MQQGEVVINLCMLGDTVQVEQCLTEILHDRRTKPTVARLTREIRKKVKKEGR